MLRIFAKPLLAIAILGVAGCVSPVVDETGPLRIDSLRVETSPSLESATAIGPALERTAGGSVIGRDPTGLPSDIRVYIDRVTYKNAIASVLVGSSNGLYTTVTVLDKNGVPLNIFELAEVSDAAINGIIGAAIAIGQDRTEVDRQLVEQYAISLRERLYGKPGHVPKVPRQGGPAAPAPTGQSVPAQTPKPAGVPIS